MNSAPVSESGIHLDLHIDGVSRPSASGTRMEIRSPATGAVLGTVAVAGEADLQDAVASAETAFRTWSARTAYDRERTLRQASAFVRTRADALGRLMALEQGKPLAPGPQ